MLEKNNELACWTEESVDRFQEFSDEELLVRYHNGEDEIIDYLMGKYKAIVLKNVRTMYLLGGETEDLIQEGMIGLIKAVRDYNGEEGASFFTFANLCVSRQIYTAIERAGRKKHIPLNYYISIYEEKESADDQRQPPLVETIKSEVENNPEALYFGKEYTEVFLNKLIERLSTLEAQVLSQYLLGVDYRGIGEALNKSPKAIDNAIQRCKQKAEKLLEENE
jgi:RNA polymerase sporulation-specific sigma factor